MVTQGVNKALAAYAEASQRLKDATEARQANLSREAEASQGSTFAKMVTTELKTAVGDLKTAETMSIQGLQGKASLQNVVEAVNAAEMSLQKVTAVRDRVISAYQEIMRMPI
ncbi:MAG: flagellar hook-basal body complex protein FliE [Pseudomonadota bacterium]